MDRSSTTAFERLYFPAIPRFARFGASMLLAMVLLALALSAMISYRDVVAARVTLVQVPPSVTLFSKANGRVTLLVGDGAEINAEQYLAVIENPARTEDMLLLKRMLHEGDDGPLPQNVLLPGPRLLLGQVQELYARFEADLLEYKLLSQANFHRSRLKLTQARFGIAQSAVRMLQAQEATLRDSYQIALKQMHGDSILFLKGYISASDLGARFMDLLQKKQALQAAQSSVLLQESQVGELQRQMYDEMYQLSEEQKKCEQTLVASFKALKIGFVSWEETYVIKSPLKGKVSFVRFLDNNAFFKPNDEICTVVPENKQLRGRVIMEPFASGKVSAGQLGRIKCDNYPYQEFGVIDATVESIAIAPHDGKYLVLVDLMQGLVTDRGRTLSFMEGMQGTIEIITGQRSLMERLIDPVASVYRQAVLP